MRRCNSRAKLKHMKFAILALFGFVACSHIPAHPPSFGFHGRVRPHHDVACVVDEEFSVNDCTVVTAAIEKIDAAVGYELLSAPRITTLLESRSATTERETIYVGATSMPPGLLGATYPVKYEKETGYLRLEVVVFEKAIFGNPFMAASVVLHEFLHAVGAVHAAQTGPWESVMAPAWRPGAPVELTPNDVAALRAAYAL